MAILGVMLHLLVVRPLLTAPPINQVLATGGVLFVLQGGATLLFSTEFRSLGTDLPPIEVWEIFVSGTKLSAFIAALLGAAVLWLFLKFTYVGTAIRAIARDREVMPLMGVDPRRIYLIASAVGGSLAGLAACLLLVQLDVHPFVGLSFGPLTFMICVMGGLGNMLGGFLAAFLMGIIVSVGGFWSSTEWSYVFAFLFFIIMMFLRPRGLFAR
jgi:branched-chain amino acid transport system permease protein